MVSVNLFEILRVLRSQGITWVEMKDKGYLEDKIEVLLEDFPGLPSGSVEYAASRIHELMIMEA